MEIQTTNLCSGCLAVDRRMLRIQNYLKEQCFSQIIKELTISVSNVLEPQGLALWLCWECEANITRFAKFKLQVKQSQQILHNLTKQNGITQPREKYSINQVVNITLSPDSENDEDSVTIKIATVKTEDSTETPLIKFETDFYDDDDDILLIDISNDSRKPKVNTSSEVNGKRVKKRNGKVNLKQKSLYKEIKLTDEEIVEERNILALRDDYVNAMFRCDRCLISFPNADDMKDHALKKHELNASKHKCSICECSFSTEVAYSYHRSRHYRRYECPLCKFKCTSKFTAKNHYSAMHIQSSAYELDHRLENRELEDNDLLCAKSGQKFPCEFCPKVFGWRASLRKHAEKHKIDAGQKRRPYCEPCRLSFTTTANLQKHAKTSSKHQIQLKLRKLKETNPETSSDKQIADIKTSVTSKLQLFPCAQCDKKFQWRGNLLRHLNSHTARANGLLVCEPCNRKFSSIATYNQHMKISKKHATENDYKYMCSECGKKFASKTKLKDHVDWDHLKNFVHNCADCKKVFKTHTSLYLHRQVVHKESSQHLCESCGKSFPNQTKLRSHTIAVHTSESPYKCGECGKRFSWHSCLSRHLRRVHRAGPVKVKGEANG